MEQQQAGYSLDQDDNNWGLNSAEFEPVIREAINRLHIRGIIVIRAGNLTGTSTR